MSVERGRPKADVEVFDFVTGGYSGCYIWDIHYGGLWRDVYVELRGRVEVDPLPSDFLPRLSTLLAQQPFPKYPSIVHEWSKIHLRINNTLSKIISIAFVDHCSIQFSCK